MTQEGEMRSGGFDPERAKKMAGDIADEFRGKLKKVQRWMLAQLMLFTLFMIFCGLCFLESGEDAGRILFGILFLVAFESTVLIKLWYWVMNAKIGVVREVKLLRLEASRREGGGGVEADGRIRKPGISSMEWAIWIGAFVVLATLVISTYRGPNAIGGAQTTLDMYVDLAADGSAKVTRKLEVGGGLMPSGTFTRTFPGKKVVSAKWYDGQWRELPSDMKEETGERQYTVHWPHPMLPTDHLTCYEVVEQAGAARREGNAWVYQDSWKTWTTSRWHVTARLPEGARVVGESPKPTMTCDRDGDGRALRGFGGLVVVDTERGRSEEVGWKVTYRIQEAGTKPTEK